MVRRTTVLNVLAVVAVGTIGFSLGCESGGGASGKSKVLGTTSASSSPAAKASATSLPAVKAPSYTVVVDGQPVVFSAAFVFGHGGEARHLLLSDATDSCDALLTQVRGRSAPSPNTAGKTKHVFEATLARSFSAAAARSWKLGRIRFNGGAAAGEQKPISIQFRAAPVGSEVTIKISEPVVLAASRQFKRPKDVRLEFGKDMKALNCGNLGEKLRPRAGVTGKLSLQILGEVFPIHGATLRKNTPPLHQFGHYALRLSSRGDSCDASGVSDVVVTIYFDEGARSANLIEVGGELVFGRNRQTTDTRELRPLKLGGTKQVGTGGELKLDGSVALAGLQLAFSGSVKPKLCPQD